jgi:hypothetical protein
MSFLIEIVKLNIGRNLYSIDARRAFPAFAHSSK